MTRYTHHDYLHLDDLLTDEHKAIRASVREWIQVNMEPNIASWFADGIFPRHLVPEMASMGLIGSYLPTEVGGHGMDQIGYGIVMQEIERLDSGIRSFASVQTSLVMYPIWAYGTPEQQSKWLPLLGSGEAIGAFGLTEPNHGSNPGGMETRFRDDGDHIVLNGSKMWITNAPIADVAVVWAKNSEGRIQGVLVERGMAGFQAPETGHKWSLRASITGELVFDNVRIPKSNLLPGKTGLGAPLKCLDAARYGIAWGAIGAALSCYDTALQYSKDRMQFDKPVAQFQLTQKKLAEMITEISKAQLLAWRVGTLRDKGEATASQVSMAKRNNVEMALKIARESRQILGAMGITGDFPIMRHMMNLESVITYEGTHDIHLLITGADITGLPAFK